MLTITAPDYFIYAVIVLIYAWAFLFVSQAFVHLLGLLVDYLNQRQNKRLREIIADYIARRRAEKS